MRLDRLGFLDIRLFRIEFIKKGNRMNDYQPENRPKPSTDTQALLAELRKQHKSLSILTTAGQLDLSLEPYSSGILSVDCVLGGGIYPRKIYEFYGPEASGKSLILYNILSSVQKRANGNLVAIYDSERSSDAKEWLEFNGVDIDNLIYIVGTAETSLDALLTCTKDPRCGIIAIDSIASMATAQEMEHEMATREVATIAGLLPKFFKKFGNYTTNTSMILINQVREAIGTYTAYGEALRTPGGRSVRHWASSLLEVRGVRKELTEGKGIEQTIKGVDVYVKAVKNRLGVEGSRSYFRFIFDQGIDEPEMVLRLAKVSGLLRQGGAWVKGTIMGEDVTFQGLEGFRTLLKSRPEFDPWLRSRILESYKKHTFVTKEEGELPDVVEK